MAVQDIVNSNWTPGASMPREPSVKMRTPLIYDGRRVLDLDSLEKAGWQTYAVGKPV